MSTALVIRQRNPDDDFVLHGGPALYTERTSFYPTNSDITNTTKKLSQHEYRADLYKEILQDDQNLRSSLRSMSRSLRLVSNNIRKNLEEESTAKRYPRSQNGSPSMNENDQPDLTYQPDYTSVSKANRKWLSDSEWNTASGHHVMYSGNVPTTTLRHKSPSMTMTDIYTRPGTNQREAENLRRTVNVDMDMAEVPLTRFTRKDLMASEYFPVTMSRSVSQESSPRRSRSRTRSPQRLTKSAKMRTRTPDRTPVTDNFRSMKRLEKLYLITSEASGIASAPPSIVSPYHEDMAKLRMERLRLEEEHLNELNRMSALERLRGPKPKWYELKDTQFHFEAGKNNDLLHTMDRWQKTRSQELSRSQPDLSTLHMRSASFS